MATRREFLERALGLSAVFAFINSCGDDDNPVSPPTKPIKPPPTPPDEDEEGNENGNGNGDGDEKDPGDPPAGGDDDNNGEGEDQEPDPPEDEEGEEEPPGEEEEPPVEDDPPPAPVTGDFIQAENGTFTLSGKEFRFNGTNAYYLPNYEILDSRVVDRAFDTFQEAQVKLIRMWGFYDGLPQYSGDTPLQPRAGEYNETGLRALDRVIAKGKERGMYFVLPLLNYWDQLGGFEQYCQWVGVELNFHAFIGSSQAQQLYRNYIHMLLNRVNTETGIAYKDEPAIHSWQIINEGRNPGHPPQEIRDWYQQIARYIKSIDSNHLVATGEEGFDDSSLGSWGAGGEFTHPDYQTGEYSNSYPLRAGEGTSYALNTAIPEIDYGNYHWYPTNWGWSSSVNSDFLRAQSAWISDHSRIAGAHGKPAILAEYGHDNAFGGSQATNMYRAIFDQIEGERLPGSLLWQLVADGTKCWEFGGNICYPSGRGDVQLFDLFRNHSVNLNG